MHQKQQKQSAALDHMRWIAAFLVVIQHARGFLMVEYYPDAAPFTKAFYLLTGFSHSAVMVFFVLSGYFVGGKALRLLSEGATADQRDMFLLDRFARIFIVLWPALLLAAAVALFAPHTPVLTAENWAGPNPSITHVSGAAQWIGTAVLLNETLTGTVGYDSPLWSLAFEWIYYALAIGALYLAARDRRPVAIAMIGYMLLLLGLCLVLRPMILGMLLCWLFGAAATRLRRGAPAWLSVPLFLGVVGYARFSPQMLWLDIVVAASTATLLTTRSIRNASLLPGLGRTLSGFSFSLYAIHIPIMLAFVSTMQSFGWFGVRLRGSLAAYGCIAIMVGTSYLLAFGFSLLTERKTNAFRDWLWRVGWRRQPTFR